MGAQLKLFEEEQTQSVKELRLALMTIKAHCEAYESIGEEPDANFIIEVCKNALSII